MRRHLPLSGRMCNEVQRPLRPHRPGQPQAQVWRARARMKSTKVDAARVGWRLGM